MFEVSRFLGFVILLSGGLLSSCAHKGPFLPMISLQDLQMPLGAEMISRNPAALSSPKKSYLGIELEVAPFAVLTKQIEKSEGVELKTRGEAHITVITPPEMQILTEKLNRQQIQDLADQRSLEKAPFKALCAGKGQVFQDRTYFVVVSSEKIFEFRLELQKLFEKKGGLKDSFQAQKYHPHVTLGFTSKDLHEHDGVIKDERSCFYVFDEGTEELLSSKSR